MTKSSSGLSSSMWAEERAPLSRPWPNSSSQVSLSSVSSAPASSASAVINTPRPRVSPPASVSASAPATASSGTRLTPAQAFHRFEQACQRLRWKFLDLQTSYQRATNPVEYNFTQTDAERNFKVDFHEFYVWIEQAIVLLLLIFGVSVSRDSRQYGGPASNAGHAYHHNVIKALADTGCPVHAALGQGEVNQALWKAKELRNRWKNAAEGLETPPLKMYDLTWIVTMVLSGLEVAYGMAAQHVANALEAEAQQPEAQTPSSTGNGENETTHDADDEWEWMVEPMDWEAA